MTGLSNYFVECNFFFMNEHDEYFHQIDHKCGDKINIIE